MLAIRVFFGYVACGLLAKIVKRIIFVYGYVVYACSYVLVAKQKVYAAM